ncbi:MAG: protein kinase [Deltaproteobacteria bacterium]|nr:protein kinase [Deltaproteobacteria bacterium]
MCPADGARADDVETLPKNTRIGAYKIERMLGEGGMGFVYEATHEVLNRRTAIKLLRPELAVHAEVVTRFLNEAKAVNLIDHQHIINVYDYGDGTDGSVYFVMEFLEGETLDDLMRKRRPMQLPLMLHVFAQIAKALAAAHGKQVVHRDLKPANVFVIAREDNPYFIKLLDFGIAQLRGEGAVKLTVAGSIMGTPQYMSPEQISGANVDARSDVWAFGVMLYRAATGQAPFKGEGFGELAKKILHETPKPADQITPMPAALAKLIASCLERKIEDRCQTIAEAIAGLERVKKEATLDDDAILSAVKADSGAISEPMPMLRSEPTKGSLAGSSPQYQGAPAAQRRATTGVPAGRTTSASRVPTLAIVGGGLAALGIVGYLAFGRGASKPDAAPAPVAAVVPATSTTPPTTPATASIHDLFTAGDHAAVRALAEKHLHDALASGQLQQQGFAVDALARVRSTRTVPLLYLALKAPPDVRVKAARALGELGLPDAAPKVRAALAESGDKIKVELAAVLYRLGDKDARAILKRATEDPGLRLTAALAMAEVNDDGGRAVLTDILETTPAGRDQWRRAAGGLAKLGDANARKALEGELSQPDATRSVGAADLLARAGDGKARAYLVRVASDKEFSRAGEAATALARLGDREAIGWVDAGLASTDLDERKLALAICGVLADASHHGAIAKLATTDPDLSVRMTADAVLLGL